jgi:hypothetical protein
MPLEYETMIEEWEKTCGFCKYFSPIPGMDKDDTVIWGNCLADPEGSDEAFNVDDPACDNWKKL